MADSSSRREQLRADFLAQTARIPFAELQRFFAAGRVLNVHDDLDLIETVVALAEDDAPAFERWTAAGAVLPVSDEQARAWLAADAQLWCVVAEPWVLVQVDSGSRRFPEDPHLD